MVDAGLYDQTAEVVLATEDLTQRAALFGRLAQQPSVARHLAEQDQIDSLLEFAEEQATPEVRNAFLNPVFSSQILTLLVERGHYARLHRFLDDDDAPFRDRMVASFYANTAVLNRLIDERQIELVLSRTQGIDAEARYYFLQRLVHRRDVLGELVQAGHYDALVSLIRAEPEASPRGSLLGSLWRSPKVSQYLVAQEKLSTVLDIMRAEDATARHSMLQGVVANSSSLDAWVRAELLEPLIELIQEDSDPRRKVELLARLATTDSVLERWAGNQRLATVLSIADSFGRAPVAADARRNYLIRVFGDRNLVQRLVRSDLYDQMLEIATGDPEPNFRSRLLKSLVANQATAEYLNAKNQVPQLLSIAREEPSEQVRRDYLNSVVTNPTAVGLLIDAGLYDESVELVLATEDAVQRAGLFGRLVQHHTVVQHLAEQKQIDTLWQFADEQTSPEARDAFLQPLFSYGGLKLLVERGHYDRLHRFLDKDTPSRDALAASFYANTAVLNRLVEEKQIELVITRANAIDVEARSQFLQRLVHQHDVLNELVEGGHFDALVSLIQSEPHASRRGSMLGSLLRTPPVVAQLAAREELAGVFGIIRAEKDADARQAMVRNLVGDSRTIRFWVNHQMLDRLIELVHSECEPRQQAALLARLVIMSPVLESWAEQQQLESVFALADSFGEKHGKATRHEYLQHVFGNPNALRVLIEEGLFESLLEVANGVPDPALRARLLQPLVENPATAAQLAKQGEPERLVEIVRNERDAAARDACLAGIVRNDAAVSELLGAGQLDSLVQFCSQTPEDAARRKLKAQLLLSPQVVKYLADQEMLADHLQAVLAEPDAEVRSGMIRQLVAQSGVLRAIDQAGMFSTLVDTLEAELAVPGIDTSVVGARHSEELHELLVDHNRIPLIVSLITASSNPATRAENLGALLAQPKVLRAVLEHQSLDRLLEQVGTSQAPYAHHSIWNHAIRSPEAIQILVKHQHLDRLLNFVRQSDANQNRWVDVQRLLGDNRLRQTLIARGEVDSLLDLLSLARAADRDRFRGELLFSPSGLVPYHLSRGETAAAEQIVQEQIAEEQTAEADEGRLMLATLLLASGNLHERIAELQQRAADAAEPDTDDLRMLVYLHRAAGDLDAAAAAAEPTGDASLIHSITLERRDWHAAAEQLAAEDLAPPVPLPRSPPSELHARVERLGRLAAYWRLAGEADEADEVLDQIEQLANDSGQAIQWDCAEALLLNDRVQAGLALLEKTHPVRAFDLLCLRQEYAAALRLLDCGDDARFDSDWYASLPLQNQNQDESYQRKQRLELAMRIARILRRLGRTDDMEKIIELLESHARQQPQMEDNQEWRRLHWQWLAGELYGMELYPRAWQAAEQAIQPAREHSVLSSLFTSRGSQAVAWWAYFRRAHRDEPVQETMQRVHRVLHPSPSDSVDDLERMIEEASDVEVMAPHQVSPFLTGLADTCIERECLELAQRLLEQVPDPRSVTWTKRAKVLRQRGRHREAGDAWMKVWEAGYHQPDALYLSGDALVHAGDVEEGEKRKEQASRMALQSRVRHRMAIALNREGLSADAAE